MTREEAIEILKRKIRKAHPCDAPAYDMAIKALEQEPCEDAISRQAVNILVDELARAISDERCCISRGRSTATIMRDILHLPPVTVEPKTGHWIVDGSVDCYLDRVRCHCSECGKKKEFPADYDHIKHKLSISCQYPEFIDNYCPKCGVKMIEPQESEDKE